MAITGPGFSIRFFFIDPNDGQVLRASGALIEGILARRRCVPAWAGMKVRSVRAAVIDADGRKRLDHVAGHHMYFGEGGYWDQPREAEVAIAFLELASGDPSSGNHHERRFLRRRVAASRWQVRQEVFASIQSYVEDDDQLRRNLRRVPWKWAHPSGGVAGPRWRIVD